MYNRAVMARKRLPDHQRLAVQNVRISPQAKERLGALPTRQKKRVIAAMRQAVELVINSMTDNVLHTAAENFSGPQLKDNFLVDSQ